MIPLSDRVFQDDNRGSGKLTPGKKSRPALVDLRDDKGKWEDKASCRDGHLGEGVGRFGSRGCPGVRPTPVFKWSNQVKCLAQGYMRFVLCVVRMFIKESAFV